MANIQMPCLGCRAGTTIEADAAAAACASCGAALPLPGAPAWLVARSGSQFGPYTIVQLISYIAERRVLPSDSVWYQGAAGWVPVGEIPGLGGVPAPALVPTPAPAQAQPQPASVAKAPAAVPQAPAGGARVGLHLRRALNWNLRAMPVEPDEEARLLANGVDEVDARRYLVWRRSVLLVVAIPTLLSAVLATISVITGDYAMASGLGITLEYVGLAPLYVLPLTAWLAARTWDRHRRSRTILLWGWLFAFLSPLLLALVPFTWRVDVSQVEVSQLATVNAAFSLVGAMAVYVTLMPAVLSLIPGVLRGCLRIKALIPESILPGLFLVAATPLYMLLFLVIFTTVNQVAGNLLLILGVLALLAAPLLYLFNAGLFTRPLRAPEEIARIGTIQQAVLVIMGLGLALMVVYAFTATLFDRALIGTDESSSFIRPWSLSLIQFPIEYFARSLFTTVLVADLFMQMNLSLWRHTKEFQASPEAESYDRLMVEIEEAGGAPSQRAETAAA